METNKQTIKKAVTKARRYLEKGGKYYDEKHNTFNPAWGYENILEHVSDLIGGYGIESYDPDNAMKPRYTYVNSGDSYKLTVIFDRRSGKIIYSDIGSIIERYTR
ncbi:hypothetical protein EBR03_09090 [bacterium]|nr:hypothetical protein [bacterium]